jgi:hypothetical protein
VNAGEMIGEMTLAIQNNCSAEDIAHTIRPHPILFRSDDDGGRSVFRNGYRYAS